MSVNNDKIGGYPVHVQDCYVWFEIYYLDSPTDYREYLPHRIQTCNVPNDGFVLLESSENNPNHSFLRILVVLAAGLIIGSLLYWHNLQQG